MGSCVKFVPKPIKLPNNANTISPTVLNCAALQIPQLIAHFPVAEPETAPVLHRGKLKLHRRLVEVIWLCVISASGSLLYYRASFPPCRAPFRVSPAFPLFLLPCSFYTPSPPFYTAVFPPLSLLETSPVPSHTYCSAFSIVLSPFSRQIMTLNWRSLR